MNASPDWATLDRALDRALDLEGDERDDFLASLDSATRTALAPLIRHALADDPLLDHPGAAFSGLAERAEDHEPSICQGVRIGPYEIEALVGEGGMGRVYRARRADGAFEQTVALKMVRQSLALAGTDVAARLRRERDLLAALDHPNIARLIDGGETEDGVPYLVTEFVDGASITSWAESRRLGVRERVRLVAEVARAVDHAHRRFVVHRDLKPSNVLVTERDAPGGGVAARPVILDFGIAKLLRDAEEATGAFPLTQTGMRLLTPAYAAPELFDPTLSVTTAADVYGIGAILYELLTGARPRDGATNGLTVEPTRPSRVLTASPSKASYTSRTLRGDLDTICLKALHLDPARRYPSASDLADDLERHLEGRPVEARPDSVWYVAGRFARRHRASVAAAAVALAALVGGLGVALVSLAGEREARAESEEAASRANEAAELLAGLFSAADPEREGTRDVTAREALGRGVASVSDVESPKLKAYLLRVLGVTYIQMGDPTRADSLLGEALAIIGDETVSEEATRIRSSYAATRDALGDSETVLALGQKIYADHRNDPDPLRAGQGLWEVSRAQLALGDLDAALANAREVERLAQLGTSPRQRVNAAILLGRVLLAVDQAEEALPVLERGLAESLEEFGPESVRTSTVRSTLARARTALGHYAEAEKLLRVSLEYQTRVFGPNTVAYVLASIAETRMGRGDAGGAAALLDSAIVMSEPLLPPNHPDIGAWLARHARALHQTGAYREAEASARRATSILEVQTPPKPDRLREALDALALALQSQGRSRDAERVRQRARAL